MLELLDLEPAPWPASVHTPTRDKPQYTHLMRRLHQAGIFDRLPRLPAPARRLGRRLLLRKSSLPQLGRADVPPSTAALLEADSLELHDRLGSEVVDWI